MPMIKIQDSDGKEQMIIAPAVIGLGIADNTYTAKIVAKDIKDVDRVVRATIKYFFDQYREELEEAVKVILKDGDDFSTRKQCQFRWNESTPGGVKIRVVCGKNMPCEDHGPEKEGT